MKSLYHALPAVFFTSLIALPLHAQEKDKSPSRDLINFENDDLLHGNFLGFTTSGKIIWKNDFAENNIAFDKSEVRKIVINKGELTKPFSHTSFIKLKNKDIIPGKITSMKDGKLILNTDYSGELSIPSKLISNIEFNPHGNQIIYRGPFAEEDKWHYKYPGQGQEGEAEKDKPNSWSLKNFSLQHKGTSSSIVMKQELPEKFRVMFHCYSNQSYDPSITILADLNVPEIDKENSTLVQNRSRYKSTVAAYLGSCLTIRPSSSASMTHYSYAEDGSIIQNNITNNIRSTSSRNTHEKKLYDLRVDTTKGKVMLYVNKKQIGQWNVNDIITKLTGKHFGFSLRYGNSTTKSIISDLIITSWNGVTDSALSLENETRDIVMLGNGTDRYSGTITAITNDTVEFKTSYAELTIPHNEINSLNFATKESGEPLELDQENTSIRFYGTGKISGKISKSEDGNITVESKTLGLIKIKSEYISSFEFVDMDQVYDSFN